MSKLLKFYPIALVGYALLPLVADAQSPNASYVVQLLSNVRANATTIITLLFIFATLVFLWGLILFIAKAEDEAARKKARGLMTWGIIGLAVMASAWGLTRVLTGYFGVEGTSIPNNVR